MKNIFLWPPLVSGRHVRCSRKGRLRQCAGRRSARTVARQRRHVYCDGGRWPRRPAGRSGKANAGLRIVLGACRKYDCRNQSDHNHYKKYPLQIFISPPFLLFFSFFAFLFLKKNPGENPGFSKIKACFIYAVSMLAASRN